MRRTTKIWLILAAALILVGCLIFEGVMTVLKWDFTKLSTVKYETNEHTIGETFRNISVDTDTADVTFALSADGQCRVECYEEKKAKHSVTVKEDTLIIQVINEKSWYDYIGIHFGSPKITVYLPQGAYAALSVRQDTGDIAVPKDFQFESVDLALSTGDVTFSASTSRLLKIQTSTGKISVENISAGALDLSASTGRITVSHVVCQGDVNLVVSTGKTNLTDIRCKNLTSNGNTGDISLKNVIASGKCSIRRSTGDVKFEASDAAEIFVETDTGDVSGSLLTEKVFIAHTDTGSVNVPKTVTGGRCEIRTNTGDIVMKSPL